MADAENEGLGSADYLERALADLNRARQQTAAEAMSIIDSAIGRLREALARVQGGAGDRAEQLRGLAEDRAADWQRRLEDASEEVRLEMAVRSIHAQSSLESLKTLSEEVRRRDQELRRT